jgi:hypothetical protein
MSRVAIAAAAAALVLAGAAPVLADEAKTPVSASMLLSIVSSPVDVRANAYDASFKDPAPKPADKTPGEVLPDGSVRYGSAFVTVRNPCPPGEHFEPPMLPGRRR